MGVVYKATDPHIGRFVAIKMITAGFAGNPDLLKRFYREAQSTGNLQNPNIVTVYDLGDHDGNPYLVMEYLEGASLESIIAARKPLAMAEKLGIIIDVCNGLSYAHQRGIIHRDIKPANVMVVNDGVAKIVDFGIARIGNTRDTVAGQVIGSIHYMSPEQLRAQPLDFRADIYSTGVVLFQLLTNELPFDASETGATLVRIIQDPAPPLSAYLKDYPPELETVIARALAKDRDARYFSAKDLAFDLLRIQEQIKQSAVRELLRRASSAIQRSEWNRAKEQLQQALRVDRQHTEAHRLLRDVQEKIEKQQKTEQARRLQMSADQAFIEGKFDDALGLLEQAIALDPTNPDLRGFRESVQATRERAAKLEDALRRAEAAQIEGNLEEASEAVAEALALDANDTQAKALKVILSREIEERARHVQARNLLEQAKAHISARRLTSAFAALQKAKSLEPDSVELQTLIKLATTAREQERRRADLEKLSAQIQEALVREDYTAACAKAAAGLQQYPAEPGLLKLQAIAEGQRKQIEQRLYVREQLAAANSLLDLGKLVQALSLLETASQSVPENGELSSLRKVLKDRLSKAEADEHKACLLRDAREAMAARDFFNAVQILEKGSADFPHSEEINDLLIKSRAEYARHKAAAEAQRFAAQLIDRGEVERAGEFLESTLRELPDQQLRDLLGKVRERLHEVNATVQSALHQAEKILDEHGAEEACKFLDAQPSAYSAAPKLRGFRRLIRQRQIIEDLDRELARTNSLDDQVSIAENALRKNQGNQDIENRLLTVREKRDVVQSIVRQATESELGQEYARAAECWRALANVYPEHSDLPSNIVRLEKLEQQKKHLLLKKAREAEGERLRQARASSAKIPASDPESLKQLLGGPAQPPHATSIFEAGPNSDRAQGAGSAFPGAQPVEERREPAFARLQTSTQSRAWSGGNPRLKILSLPVVLVGLITSILVVKYGGRLVDIHVETDPSGSEIAIGGTRCTTPCDLRLKPGTYKVEARHAGYDVLSRELKIDGHGLIPPLRLPPTAPAAEPPLLRATGFVWVDTNVEGANVFVDGVLKGITGHNNKLRLQLDAGSHELRVQKQGYEETAAQNVAVVANINKSASFTLGRPATPSVLVPTTSTFVLTTLPGADIRVDKNLVGRVPKPGVFSVSVKPGEHRIETHLDGYETWSARAMFKAGDKVQIYAEMKRLNPAVATSPRLPSSNPTQTQSQTQAQAGTAISVAPNQQVPPSQPVDARSQMRPQETPTVQARAESKVDSKAHSDVSSIPETRTKDQALSSPQPPRTTVSTNLPSPAASPTPTAPSVGDTEIHAIEATLDRYKDAYESESVDELLKIWPSMSKDQKKALKSGFESAQAIKVSLSCGNPSIAGDAATVKCDQSVRYTRAGKIEPSQTVSVDIILKKKQAMWTVAAVRAN